MANLFMRGEYKRSGRFLRLHKSATSGMFVPRGAFSPPLRADIRAVHCSSRSGQSTILQPKPRPLDLPYTSPGSPFSPQSPAQQPKTLREDLRLLPADIAKLLASTHPDLDLVSNYYFAGGGKHIRPLLVLLIARATNGLSPDFPRLVQLAEGSDKKHLEGSVAPEKVLNNHDQQEFLAIFSTPFALSSASQPLPPPRNRPLGTFPSQLPILPTQYRLAEISEMIHISSLFHDDVLDDAATRRNLPSAPAAFGNKVSVLGGVFVLGRWMTALAGLGNLEVVELLLSVTSDLVQGELMQLSPLVNEDGSIHREARALAWQQYMQKTYLKTATLLAKSARASVILGGGGRLADGIEIKDVAYAFGRNLGMAFQIIDDMLDFTTSAEVLGKPSDGADLKLGLATAPALFAWEEHVEMDTLIARKFKAEGDVQRAMDLIRGSDAIPRTRQLAQSYIDAACEALYHLPESDARDALVNVGRDALERSR